MHGAFSAPNPEFGSVSRKAFGGTQCGPRLVAGVRGVAACSALAAAGSPGGRISFKQTFFLIDVDQTSICRTL
jgi:hypothetical protein